MKTKQRARIHKRAPSSERIFSDNGLLESKQESSEPNFFGCVDIISHEQISGWVWNPLDPEEKLFVEIYDGENQIIKVQADAYRGDLKSAGIGTGKYGFSVSNPSVLLPHARHRVAVRRAKDGVELPGSPQMLVRPGSGLDTSLEPLLEAATNVTAQAARAPADLDHQLSFTLRLMNQLLAARHRLEGDQPLVSDPRLQDILREAELSDWTRELIEKVRSDYPPLHFEVAEQPLVSIIIPLFNKFSVTYNCLKSIIENRPKCSFEIILVDDCSTDETLFAGFVLSGAARIVRNESNQGFVRSCNAGAARATGKYLFFLNNDTLVRSGWLDELCSTFEATPNVGIAGSKLLFEDGSLQEAGGIMWRLGDGWNWGRNADPKDPRFCYMRDADYVSGAALMLERSLFEQLKGFDEYFAPAYYEDTDLCFRVRALGKRVVVQPASEIVHLEGVSAGREVTGSGMKRFQLINHRKFYARWKDTLASHRFNGELPDLESERLVERRAYFIDDTVPTPDKDAGSNAALQHMITLMQLGYKVTFIPADNMAQINPYTANLEKLGIECLYAPFWWSVEEVFRKGRPKPDLVYLHRYANAAKYAALVRQHFPDCFIVYNVADLHSLRQQRELEIEGSIDAVRTVSEEAELAAMRNVDSVIVHSSVEAAYLHKRDPKLRVHTVPWTIPLRSGIKKLKDASGYAFIGGYGHRPNVDAAEYLAREIVPLLRRRSPEIKGFLVGSHAPPKLSELESNTLKLLGYVPDLTTLLHGLRCTVAPLRYGAGLKGKILESFAHGLPCIMSEVAAEGLELPKHLLWLIARTPKDFADKITAIHEDEPLVRRLSSEVVEYVQKGYGADTVQGLLASATSRHEQAGGRAV